MTNPNSDKLPEAILLPLTQQELMMMVTLEVIATTALHKARGTISEIAADLMILQAILVAQREGVGDSVVTHNALRDKMQRLLLAVAPHLESTIDPRGELKV